MSMRVHMRGAVARELDGLQPGPAADVQAALVGADPFAVQVLPDQEAALRGGEHARLDGDVGEGERVQRRPRASVQRGAGARCAAGEIVLALVGQRVGPGVAGLGVGERARARPRCCSGPTPQQPPMICAPSSRQPSASSAYSSAPTPVSWRQPAADR